MASSPSASALETLQQTLLNINNVLDRFIAVQSTPLENTPQSEILLNPLHLLSSAARLLKAQTTKLSLLIITPPFTPSEITHILNSLNESLMHLQIAYELCVPEKYTQHLRSHILSKLLQTFHELKNLLSSITTDAPTPQRATLPSTGVLWSNCDSMILLEETGLIGLTTTSVQQNHSLLKDAITELEDWDPTAPLTPSSSGSISPPLSPPPSPPSQPTPPQIAATALQSKVLTTLRLISLLYPAILKRRISTFHNITGRTFIGDFPEMPPTALLPPSELVLRFDKLIAYTRLFSEEADEVAGALYAGDEAEVEERLGVLRGKARECVEGVRKGWGEEEDEFSTWSGKWLARMAEL